MERLGRFLSKNKGIDASESRSWEGREGLAFQDRMAAECLADIAIDVLPDVLIELAASYRDVPPQVSAALRAKLEAK